MSHYFTTTDPEVVAVVERNKAGRADLIERALAWAKERGFDHAMMNGWLGTTYVAGLASRPDGFGQWTKPKRGSSKPFSNNEAEQKALSALRFAAEPVPGLPEALHSVSDYDGRRYLMYPTPFVHNDAAWVYYAHRIDPSELAQIGAQWSECLASQYHAAKEALS